MAIVLFLGSGSGGSNRAAAQQATTGGMTGGGTPGWTITYVPTTCVWESHGQYGDSSGAWPSPYNACTVGVGGVNGPPWPTKYGSCACSGTVKAHLVWSDGNTGEPPPPVVLVEEHSSAQWYGDSGDCDCGLPNVVTTPNSGGVLKEGHRWTAVTTNGETSLDVPATCSPSASAAIAQSSVKDAGGCSAEYHVVLHNVRLTISNVLPGYDADECLIGQGHSGSVSADGLSIDQQQWSVSGELFKSYVIAGDHSTAFVTFHVAADWAVPSPHWYWKVEGDETVTCTGRLLDGGTPVAMVSVTRPVEIWKPYCGFAAHLVTSQLFFTGSAYGTSVPNQVESYDPAAVGDPSEGNAIEFYGAVGTQDRFKNFFGGSGQHGYVQLANIDDVIVWSGGPFFSRTSTNGEYWLDNDFQYPACVNGPPFWADSTEEGVSEDNEEVAEDAPSLGLPTAAEAFEIFDQYDMYQLYLPPGNDSNWVPLNHISWSLYGTYEEPWLASGNPVPGSYIRIDFSGAATAHPTWEHVFSNF